MVNKRKTNNKTQDNQMTSFGALHLNKRNIRKGEQKKKKQKEESHLQTNSEGCMCMLGTEENQLKAYSPQWGVNR